MLQTTNVPSGGIGGSGGGSGPPSATSVPAFTDGGFGASRGGKGAPSAYSVRSILTRSPAETLTNRTTGSTIKTANTETATASIIFFKGGASSGQHEEGQSWRDAVLGNVPYAEHGAA